MNRFLLRSAGALAILGFFLAALSCAHDQQLVSISVEPNTETFGASNIPVPANAGLSVQLKAFGHYIHPPVTKDVTNEVVWFSNSDQIATVSSTGLLTASGQACGGALVFASITNNFSSGDRPSKGAQVTGQMSTNVVCFTGSSGNTVILTVLLVPANEGTVTISSQGQQSLNCTITCPISFPKPTTADIILTAAANPGHTFTGWTGCVLANGPQCTIPAGQSSDLSVQANFQ